VETCIDQIAQENDYLKREVKNFKHKVNKLKKQDKVQPPQDNRSNVVKSLRKEKPYQRLFLNLQRSKLKIRRMKK
jgi:cell division protein FtsB